MLPTQLRQRPKRWRGTWASFGLGVTYSTAVAGLCTRLRWGCCQPQQPPRLPTRHLETGTRRVEEVEVMGCAAFPQQPQPRAFLLGQPTWEWRLSASRTPPGRGVGHAARAFPETPPPATPRHLGLRGLSFNQPPYLQVSGRALRPPRGCRW